MVIDASYCAAPLTSAMQLGLMDSTSCQWKPKWEMAQLQIEVVAEEKKADAELFQILAEAIGKNNVALSEKSEWSKKSNEHAFVEPLAFYRREVLSINPSCIAQVKEAAQYDTSKQSASTKHYCHLHGPNNTNEEER